jgi:hypothetical protein
MNMKISAEDMFTLPWLSVEPRGAIMNLTDERI